MPRAPAPIHRIDSPRYDRRVSAPPAPAPRVRPGDHAGAPTAAARRPRSRRLATAGHPGASPFSIARSCASRAEVRLTALAIWRGVIGVYNSDDLTFAASIAYYSLLSLFPFFLLLFSVIAGVTSSETDRQAVLDFVLRYFPRQFDFVTSAAERDAGSARAARRRRQHPDGLGGDGRVRRDHVRGQPRLGRREAAELLQAQDDLVRHAGDGEPAAGGRARAGQRDQRRRGAAGSPAVVERHAALQALQGFARRSGRARSRSSSSSAWSSTSCRTPR